MAKKKRKGHYSGIGGQAVIEGIMMKNKDRYAVAVRTPSGDIDVAIEEYDSFTPSKVLLKIPFIRGIFNFIDSLILGIRTLNYSATFYEEEPKRNREKPKLFERIFGDFSDKILSFFTLLFSLAFAIALFMLAPYFLSQAFNSIIVNHTVIAIIEGVLRVVIFIFYIVIISLNKDIKRVYKYHAAEHKCINCLESGHILTVDNVRKSSRIHKRCGTSFMFFVVFISIIFFMFIRVDDPIMRVVIRLLLLPVIAGVSYEIIRLAGRSNNIIVKILSAPGMMLQRLTTCELDGAASSKGDEDAKKYADDDIIEVAIASIDAVFEWREYLIKEFGYDPSDVYMQ